MSPEFKIVSAINIGRFANPNLRKGIGFGIIYSIVDRNRHDAASKAIIFSLLLFINNRVNSAIYNLEKKFFSLVCSQLNSSRPK